MDLTGRRPLKIFDLIEHFGGYGFNKSHSTAYALVAYQTAYLKAHYPTEYMAAVLTSEMDGAERDKFFVEHIDDCRRMGIEVLAPNVNGGGVSFRVAREGQIHFGLGAIKGVGVKAVEAIVKARQQGGPFLSLDDFFERVSTREVSSACAETLIRAGAFDVLGARRAQLWPFSPRDPGGTGQARRSPPRPARALRRSGGREPAGIQKATARAMAMRRASRTCPTFPSWLTPSSWAARRRRSASTCRATR